MKRRNNSNFAHTKSHTMLKYLIEFQQIKKMEETNDRICKLKSDGIVD